MGEPKCFAKPRVLRIPEGVFFGESGSGDDASVRSDEKHVDAGTAGDGQSFFGSGGEERGRERVRNGALGMDDRDRSAFLARRHERWKNDVPVLVSVDFPLAQIRSRARYRKVRDFERRENAAFFEGRSEADPVFLPFPGFPDGEEVASEIQYGVGEPGANEVGRDEIGQKPLPHRSEIEFHSGFEKYFAP